MMSAPAQGPEGPSAPQYASLNADELRCFDLMKTKIELEKPLDPRNQSQVITRPAAHAFQELSHLKKKDIENGRIESPIMKWKGKSFKNVKPAYKIPELRNGMLVTHLENNESVRPRLIDITLRDGRRQGQIIGASSRSWDSEGPNVNQGPGHTLSYVPYLLLPEGSSEEDIAQAEERMKAKPGQNAGFVIIVLDENNITEFGREGWLEVDDVSLLDPSRILGVIGEIHNPSDLRLLRKPRKQVSHALKTFLQSGAHIINVEALIESFAAGSPDLQILCRSQTEPNVDTSNVDVNKVVKAAYQYAREHYTPPTITPPSSAYEWVNYAQLIRQIQEGVVNPFSGLLTHNPTDPPPKVRLGGAVNDPAHTASTRPSRKRRRPTYDGKDGNSDDEQYVRTRNDASEHDEAEPTRKRPKYINNNMVSRFDSATGQPYSQRQTLPPSALRTASIQHENAQNQGRKYFQPAATNTYSSLARHTDNFNISDNSNPYLPSHGKPRQTNLMYGSYGQQDDPAAAALRLPPTGPKGMRLVNQPPGSRPNDRFANDSQRSYGLSTRQPYKNGRTPHDPSNYQQESAQSRYPLNEFDSYSPTTPISATAGAQRSGESSYRARGQDGLSSASKNTKADVEDDEGAPAVRPPGSIVRKRGFDDRD